MNPPKESYLRSIQPVRFLESWVPPHQKDQSHHQSPPPDYQLSLDRFSGAKQPPQRIHPPPRRIRHILIIIQPTRKANRIRRNESTGIRVVVSMPVVMQAGFRIVVLALETERVIDFCDLLLNHIPVGAVGHRPHEFALLVGQLLGGRSQMVQVVIIDFGLFRAVAIYQRQGGFEAVRFVQ